MMGERNIELDINDDLNPLYNSIAELIVRAKRTVAITANAELAILNWQTGVHINDFVLKGNRAAYGKKIITNLSKKLTENFGAGWSAKHLMHCLRAAECFSEAEIVSAVQRQLSWTYLKTIAHEEKSLKREFYLEMAIAQRWNTRTLAAQIAKAQTNATNE